MKAWELATIGLALVVAMAIGSVPITQEPARNHRYTVQIAAGSYLYREAYQRGGTWGIKTGWTQDPRKAWVYADYQSALTDSREWGGVAEPIENRSRK